MIWPNNSTARIYSRRKIKSSGQFLFLSIGCVKKNYIILISTPKRHFNKLWLHLYKEKLKSIIIHPVNTLVNDLFNNLIFIEHLICASIYSRCWGYSNVQHTKNFLFLQYVSFWWVRQHIINQLIKNKIIDISNKLEKYSTESF